MTTKPKALWDFLYLQDLNYWVFHINFIFMWSYLSYKTKTSACFNFFPLYDCLEKQIHIVVVDVQLLSYVWLFATPSLSFSISWSLLKLMSIELVMPSNHLRLCCPLLLPSVFPNEIHIQASIYLWLFVLLAVLNTKLLFLQLEKNINVTAAELWSSLWVSSRTFFRSLGAKHPRDYQIAPWKDSPYPGHHLRCWDEQWAAAQLAALILT